MNRWDTVCAIFAAAMTTLFLSEAAQADLSISSQTTQNVTCKNAVCSATDKDAVLNVNDLEGLLGGSNVVVKSGKLAKDIRIDAALTWSNASGLTLDAHRSLTIRKPIVVEGTSSLTISTHDRRSSEILTTSGKGRVVFWDLGSVLTINGHRYKLEKDLHQLSADVQLSPSGFFALADNYDASADGAYASSPVNTLLGVFEGLGNTISNLSINDSSSFVEEIGLFNRVGDSNHPGAGFLEDLYLTNANVVVDTQTSSPPVGILAGYNYGTILRVQTSGSVSGYGYLGGLVGDNEGVIQDAVSHAAIVANEDSQAGGGLVGYSGDGALTNSYATGSVTGALFSGGLVGELFRTPILRCHATGKVQATFWGGGLVGEEAGVITLSYATGKVTVTGAAAGGLTGSGGEIHQSYATGSVSGAAGGNGGLAGADDAAITDSYSTGAVSNGGYLGGLIGEKLSGFGTVTSSYSIGPVSHAQYYLGGFVGLDGSPDGSFGDTFWDTDTSGVSDLSEGAGSKPNDPGIAGLSDAQLKSTLPDGFDPKIWGQSQQINNGYPYLLANPPH
jgi:hypothetical protein